ncbi:hypothetical protein ASU31_15605 [Pedobacter ginsenosidimutans]|uniref:Uncharacterized protein n=1 Tax=Pedobacter ginsenosidimutans TaxID=687842 RepID=A0A0T5VN41_9SPHI|nr:hypothetical protein [Pedobacter ginsenosidimutans]KRT15103.1 hypothetical protein ASU31_15605 [Pedobacter ginsenosidimutans]
MNKLEAKVLKAIDTKKLNPEILGERKWYNYFIRVTELVWSRNFRDGYLIEIYSEKSGNHLLSLNV